ncbi:MAG: hypothetical protein ABI460_01960 [Caldimonas sp.]
MSPLARWLRIVLLACAAAFVMAAWAPADLPDSGWAPEASRSTPDATRDHA